MKALFLTNEYPPYVYGGAGVHVEYLTRELSKMMEIEVRCFGDQEIKNCNLQVKGFDYDKKAFEHCPRKLKSPLTSLSNCISFNSHLIDAQVVHCHTWYTHFGGILAKISYGIPFVITTHSLEPLRPWKREQLGLGYELSTWTEKTAIEMADAIIAVSQGMKYDILKFFNVKEDRIKVIYNGIDTEEYVPLHSRARIKDYGINPDIPYVLFVGRITRQKGIIHLVNAVKYFSEDVQIVLCGGQPDTEEIKNEMEKGVKEIQKTRKNVVWIRQWVDKDAMIEIFSHAAVFCCPSIYEPFGFINLEAMACSTPVVASAVGGIKEVVEDEVTGYLVELEQYDKSPFEAKDPEKFSRDLAEKINKLMNDESLRTEMGKKGRERAEKLFSWKSIAQDVYKVYESLV
jgi:starch synthase